MNALYLGNCVTLNVIGNSRNRNQHSGHNNRNSFTNLGNSDAA